MEQESALSVLKKRIAKEFPDARLQLSQPKQRQSRQELDVIIDKHYLLLECRFRDKRGPIGVSNFTSSDDISRPYRPMETHESIESAFDWVSKMLRP